jgi:5-deoxy-glucuronate isomerase
MLSVNCEAGETSKPIMNKTSSSKSLPSKAYFEPIPLTPGIHRPEQNPCTVIDFALLVLAPGESHTFATGDREYGLDVISGVVTIRVGTTEFGRLGGRANMFDGPPAAAYAGCEASVTITAHTAAQVALASCPSATRIEPYAVVDAAEAGRWGEGNTERDFRFLISGSRPSERLWLAEVTVSDGRWATYPPHKHEDVPGDVFQEEMYYYRTDPPHGFGFCASFEGQVGGDEAFLIRDSTLHKMPHGYHTVAAAPGYRVCYLALFAGRDKQHQPSPHPIHVNFSKNLQP